MIKINSKISISCLILFSLFIFTISAFADDDAELAKKTQNPIADLISVPIQNNWDFNIGPEDATYFKSNIQPVIPISITDDMNLITRTIVPVLNQESPVPDGSTHSGLGDITQSFFFSPKKSINGWIAGGGPVLLYPSATEDELGSEKWGAGPTVVLLKQEDGWTYGGLSNQIWSFAGSDSRTDVNATFLQPFLAYTTKTYTTYGLNTESTYDWEGDQWSAPINATITQLLKVKGLPISFQAGPRYYAETVDGGPRWGVRFALTLLFPKK
jgi:hypothetical protein